MQLVHHFICTYCCCDLDPTSHAISCGQIRQVCDDIGLQAPTAVLNDFIDCALGCFARQKQLRSYRSAAGRGH